MNCSGTVAGDWLLVGGGRWVVRLTQQAGALRLATWWIVPVIAFGYLFSTIMPVFYFALYRNEGTLRFPKHLRLLSLTTALVFGLFAAWNLSVWIGSIGSYWRAISMLDWRSGGASILAVARDPRTLNQVASLLDECSNLAYILLLIAFFRHADNESTGAPVPGLLGFVTKAAVILYGIWVAFNLVRLAAIPFIQSYLRHLALNYWQGLRSNGHASGLRHFKPGNRWKS